LQVGGGQATGCGREKKGGRTGKNDTEGFWRCGGEASKLEGSHETGYLSRDELERAGGDKKRGVNLLGVFVSVGSGRIPRVAGGWGRIKCTNSRPVSRGRVHGKQRGPKAISRGGKAAIRIKLKSNFGKPTKGKLTEVKP